MPTLRAVITQDGQTVTADAVFTLTGEQWDAELNGVYQGTVVLPAGQRTLVRDVEIVNGSLVVDGGVLGMRPGSRLRFNGGDPDLYVGGGMQWDPSLHSNDHGLWVIGDGQLDIAGTPKAGWNRTGVDPSWGPQDELWIAATAVGDWTPRRWFPGDPVPQVDPRVPAAEVVNVTRDCVIEGVGHIHINSTQPQRIEYVRLQGLGISNAASGGTVLGRYALHLHMCGDGSRGTVVRGVAAVDSRGSVFVPHISHGIAMLDVVSINSYGSGMFWDLGEPSHDIFIDHAAFLGILMPGEIGNSNHDCFVLGVGDNTEVRNSVATGARGSDLAIGFDWPEMPIIEELCGGGECNPVWRFDLGNVAHNNEGTGIRFWNNNQLNHRVQDFISYHNHSGAIENGAYGNANRYTNILTLKDGYGGWFANIIRPAIIWQSNSFPNQLDEPAAIINSTIIAADGPAMTIGHRNLPALSYMRIEDSTLSPAIGQPKVFVLTGGHPWQAHFIRSDIVPDDIDFEDLTGSGMEDTHIIIENADGSGWDIRVIDSQKVVTPR